MKVLAGTVVQIAELDRQQYICDLVNFDGPLVSLFKERHANWIHLWCDADEKGKRDRWAVFPVTRPKLVAYLQKTVTLRALVLDAGRWIVVDKKAVVDGGEAKVTRNAKCVSIADLGDYLPSHDSLFDESMTPDISLTRELAPTLFDVPVDGQWFVPDLTRFSKSYTRLYSFFYCTAPRFVTNLQSRIERYMHAPWKGGYSRLNLFDAMDKQIPAIHEMRLAEYVYRSPGQMRIEALDSIGVTIKDAVLAYVEHRDQVLAAQRIIDGVLGTARLRKRDLSKYSDKDLERAGAVTHIPEINARIAELATCLSLQDQFAMLRDSAPNSVVSAKAILAFMRQLGIVAEYQHQGMLDLNKATITHKGG